jgi:N-methylhydantoinase B
LPDRLFAAPAGTSGNFALGGIDQRHDKPYVMYLFTGGGYGGSLRMDGLTNGCSTIGISTMQPIEVLEQRYPILFKEFSLREGSGGAGRQRGGFGVNYTIQLRQGWGRASFVMDHGRFGPQGVLGGEDGAVNVVRVERNGENYIPPHLSKAQDIEVAEGDLIHVSTPGGGGYGEAKLRDPSLIERDLRRGYYTEEQASALWGEQMALIRRKVEG